MTTEEMTSNAEHIVRSTRLLTRVFIVAVAVLAIGTAYAIWKSLDVDSDLQDAVDQAQEVNCADAETTILRATTRLPTDTRQDYIRLLQSRRVTLAVVADSDCPGKGFEKRRSAAVDAIDRVLARLGAPQTVSGPSPLAALPIQGGGPGEVGDAPDTTGGGGGSRPGQDAPDPSPSPGPTPTPVQPDPDTTTTTAPSQTNGVVGDTLTDVNGLVCNAARRLLGLC